MIRSEHSLVEYDFQRLAIRPDRLRRGADADYLIAAKQMLQIYRRGIGQQRNVLHGRVEQCLLRLPACPPRRIAAFCKLLDDHSEYESKRGAAFDLRRKVFDLASQYHPIVEHREGIFDHELQLVRAKVAEAIGMPWPEIENKLFGDVIELQKLNSFGDKLTAAELLSIYNVAQTQAALYRATRVRIDATEDFKTIVKHAKLAGLMHRIDRIDSGGKRGYRFVLDGPQASLRETTRYGIRFASLVPKLLACRGWHMTAEVLGPRKQKFRMELSPADGLRSVLAPPDDFDSTLESDVDAAWCKAGIDGWDWQRESELLVEGQTVMTPDFTLYNSRRNVLIYVEVVGFWTPEYLDEKCQRLRQFMAQADLGQQSGRSGKRSGKTVKWLLVVSKQVNSDQQKQLAELKIPIVCFDKKSDPQSWIDAVLSESSR
ncbi:MAG: DUF790 family protein [Planctomycetales bacterium]|nr:DUF790 family protein [Planctomycetales bacterium]